MGRVLGNLRCPWQPAAPGLLSPDEPLRQPDALEGQLRLLQHPAHAQTTEALQPEGMPGRMEDIDMVQGLLIDIIVTHHSHKNFVLIQTTLLARVAILIGLQ